MPRRTQSHGVAGFVGAEYQLAPALQRRIALQRCTGTLRTGLECFYARATFG
jgi:hypothetical protein